MPFAVLNMPVAVSRAPTYGEGEEVLFTAAERHLAARTTAPEVRWPAFLRYLSSDRR